MAEIVQFNSEKPWHNWSGHNYVPTNLHDNKIITLRFSDPKLESRPVLVTDNVTSRIILQKCVNRFAGMHLQKEIIPFPHTTITAESAQS